MTTFTPRENRVLDREPAEVFHRDGKYEVRAGLSRVTNLDLWVAFLIRDAHNECLRNESFALSRRHGSEWPPLDAPFPVERAS